MSQGNSICSYLKQTNVSFFFPFTKLENRRAEQVLPEKGLVIMGGGKYVRG
jgi:hypothetical protein